MVAGCKAATMNEAPGKQSATKCTISVLQFAPPLPFWGPPFAGKFSLFAESLMHCSRGAGANPPLLYREPGTRRAHRAVRQGQPRRLRPPQSPPRRTKVTALSKQTNSLIFVREPVWAIGCRDETRRAKDPTSNVASAEIAGRRTPVLLRPAIKGRCVARRAPRLDRRSHPRGRPRVFLVWLRLPQRSTRRVKVASAFSCRRGQFNVVGLY